MRWRISWSENGELLGACQLLILTNPKCLNHIWTFMIKPSCDHVNEQTWHLVPEILFNARWKRRPLKGQCIQEAKLSKQGPKCWEEKEDLIILWSLFFISSHYLSNFLEHWVTFYQVCNTITWWFDNVVNKGDLRNQLLTLTLTSNFLVLENNFKFKIYIFFILWQCLTGWSCTDVFFCHTTGLF